MTLFILHSTRASDVGTAGTRGPARRPAGRLLSSAATFSLLAFAAVPLSATAASATVTPSPVTITQTPVADTAVNEYAKARAYGSLTNIGVEGSGPSNTPYFKLALPQAPSGTELSSATFRVRSTAESAAGSQDGFSVVWASSDWTEPSVVWANRPALTTQVVGTVAGPLARDAYQTVTLDPAAVSAKLGQTATIAFTSTSNDGFWFFAKEISTAAYRPQLTLNFTPIADRVAPTAPGQVKASAVTDTSVAVSWTPATDDRGVIAGYTVQRSTNPSFPSTGTTVVTARATDVSLTDASLAPGSYYYRVLAIDPAGNVGPATASPAVVVRGPDVTPPTTPGIPKATVAAGRTVSLAWTPSTDDRGTVASYAVVRRTAGSSGTSASSLAGTSTETVTTTSTSYTESGLAVGTYTYAVSASDAVGNVSQAATVTVVMPADSTLPYIQASSTSTTPRVWAHYFPPYPVSLDNKDPSADYYANNYLNPFGEGSKFFAVGGLLRDRPLARPVIATGYQVTDMVTEIKQAKAAGIDGFTVDTMGISGQNWTRTLALVTAAEQVGGFTIIPNIDASASITSSSTTAIVDAIAPVLRSSAAERLPDGRVMLSSFAAEKMPVSWWTDIESQLSSRYGIKVAFVAVMLSSSDTNMKAFAPISYALSEWGVRSTAALGPASTRAPLAHALGVKWIEPIAVQDERPQGKTFDEAGNTETLRAEWTRAIADKVDGVQMTTWNDYSEGSSFAPSAHHGYSFLDISGYYASQFKTGAAPAIVQDGLYLTHRTQSYSAIPTLETSLMKLRQGSTPARDTVEVLSMLTAPADVTITVGASTYTYSAPAGVYAKTVPLGVGSVSAVATRSGLVAAKVATAFPVVGVPTVQDLQYVAAGSLR